MRAIDYSECWVSSGRLMPLCEEQATASDLGDALTRPEKIRQLSLSGISALPDALS